MATSIDPAVRSVRIAATLHDRFRVVMSTPASPADGIGELELRIDEAQQIYPEIWTHLNEARAALAGRGVDTSAFDAVRASEPKGSLGVSRVDVHTYATSFTGDLLGVHDEQVKTAQFNLEGFRRASQAIQALMAAQPEVDWRALERAENAEIAAAGSLGPVSPKALGRWVAILGGAGVLVYAFWYFVIRTPPRDHVAERKARIVEYRKQADLHPCKRSYVDSLANELAWDEPRVDSAETRAAYRATCKDRIVRLEAALAANACDKRALDDLAEAFMDRDGHIDKASRMRNDYEARCKDSP